MLEMWIVKKLNSDFFSIFSIEKLEEIKKKSCSYKNSLIQKNSEFRNSLS